MPPRLYTRVWLEARGNTMLGHNFIDRMREYYNKWHDTRDVMYVDKIFEAIAPCMRNSNFRIAHETMINALLSNNRDVTDRQTMDFLYDCLIKNMDNMGEI